MDREPGLKDWSISIDFNQDFGAGQLDSILWPLLGTKLAFLVRPDSAAVSTSNPEWTGMAILTGYPPLGNSVGDLADGSLSLEGAGELARATS